MKQKELRSAIHEYIVENFLFGRDEIGNDTPLVSSGILDSTGVLELVLFLEEGLGLSVSDDEVLPEHFDSVDALAHFAARKAALGPTTVAGSSTREAR